jgi:general secretion pathway protein C
MPALLLVFRRYVVRYQNSISIVLSSGMWIISMWVLGQLIWMPFENVGISEWKPTVSEHSNAKEGFDTRLVKQKNLFGIFQKQDEQRASVLNAPKTKLDLKLVGVVVSDDRKKDLAIIALQGKQSTYGLDEFIEGTRVSLKAVLRDRVIISNAGRDETLMMEERGLRQSGVKEYSLRDSRPAPDDHEDYSRGVQPKTRLEQIKREIEDDPQTLFQYVRLSQMKQDGKIIGYRVSPGRSPALFRSVGLKNGDIAVKLNDIDLTKQDAMKEVMSVLSELSEVNLTVDRGGQTHEIYIQF